MSLGEARTRKVRIVSAWRFKGRNGDLTMLCIEF